MSHAIPTIKVKPWGDDQGDYVLINECDFDAEVYELFEEADGADPKPSDGLTVAELKEALEAAGIEIPEGAKKADLAALLDAITAESE